jgi:uncharacterized protein (TIGR02246 family)
MTAEEEIEHQLDLWNIALCSANPVGVSELYSEDSVLLPTFSNRLRRGRSEICDYFEHFLINRPYVEIVQSNIRVIGEFAANSGIYNFHFSQGPIECFQGRFTFVYRKDGEEWFILQHHSSAIPEECAK